MFTYWNDNRTIVFILLVKSSHHFSPKVMRNFDVRVKIGDLNVKYLFRGRCIIPTLNLQCKFKVVL